MGKTKLTISTLRFQKSLTLPSRSRGSYLITDQITKDLPEIQNYKVGLLTLFIQHTSCALSLNENWDEDVRADMSDALDRIVPEDKRGGMYKHDAEGSDDMPVRLYIGRGWPGSRRGCGLTRYI
jgi:secondary thiamine-phosphate synthase enzyme